MDLLIQLLTPLNISNGVHFLCRWRCWKHSSTLSIKRSVTLLIHVPSVNAELLHHGTEDWFAISIHNDTESFTMNANHWWSEIKELNDQERIHIRSRLLSYYSSTCSPHSHLARHCCTICFVSKPSNVQWPGAPPSSITISVGRTL